MTTFLIEKYNEKKTGFIEYICSPSEENISLSDDEVWKLKEELTVKSMEEIVERFRPEVSIWLGRDQITIPVCHREGFFWQVINLWETIRQGRYTNITKKDLEDSLLIRDSINEQEFINAQEQIFIYLHQNRIQKAKEQVKKCAGLYNDKLFLMKRLITEAELYLQESETIHRRFVVEAKEGMSLQCVAVSEPFQKSRYHTERLEEMYQHLLKETLWNVCADKLQKADVLQKTEIQNGLEASDNKLLYWNLLLACQKIPKQKRKELEAVLEEAKEAYKAAKEQFLWQVKPLMQTLFNCYRYFKNPDAGELLITNCTLEELAEARCKKPLIRYLETVNQKQYREDAVEKLILPNIEAKQKKETLTRERFMSAGKEMPKSYTNGIEAAEILRNIFEQFEIETRMVFCEEGEPLGYALTGIDVLNQMTNQEDEKELRDLTIWLNNWKLQGEEE